MIKNKKGFTLIEIIVVVVILAVLMAVAVPSVLKYLDEADDAKYMAQARAAYTIMKTEITKALVNDSDGILDASDIHNVLANCDFSNMPKIIGVATDVNIVSGSTETITKNNIPNVYYLQFGTIDVSGGSPVVNAERFATIKENEIVNISKNAPENVYFVTVNYDG